MDKIIEKMELKTINPARKGFPGVLKFWLPKYIIKKVTVMNISELDSEREKNADK
ncbi:hypothetical protein [Butyrivibrio sp. INlla16]|uniref:hypothetical protein n=1 Tax=Butyrivibrio sp. INlla16 TaxID=1520807 RepID=UPI00088F5D95|nr:hypothetical protein [Butyrivibrio sp. INlla16]SDB14041.1 hypothetical protein SAMN02910263_00652 [Butyrivibrio sp. INlla16]